MNIIDVGSGPPLVLVPGVQGRWEWMRRAIDALAVRCRVITFSLANEPTSGAAFDPALGATNYVRQVSAVLDAQGLARAAVCGSSLGGLIASTFAARHPERVTALVLASALPPSWRPTPQQRTYALSPWLFAPAFAVASLGLYGEIASAAGGPVRGLPLAAGLLASVAANPTSPARMAERVACWFEAPSPDMSRVSMPTLVVTGEAHLDRVVPVAMTHEYLAVCAHATAAVIARTGHLGIVTRPDEFATVVGGFVQEHAPDVVTRRRVG